MEATLASRIQSSGQSGTHDLRTSSLKHTDSYIHRVKTFFVEGSTVQQLDLLFVFFWLEHFVFLVVLGPFYFVRYLNRAVWLSI